MKALDVVDRARSACVTRLERAMEAATRRGDLDEATRIRERVEALREEAALPDEDLAERRWALFSRKLEGTNWRRSDTGGTVTLGPGGACGANNYGKSTWEATGSKEVAIAVESALLWPQKGRLRYRLVDPRTAVPGGGPPARA